MHRGHMQGTLPISALEENNVKVSDRPRRGSTREMWRRERGAHLHVDVRAVVDQELEAEGTVRGRGGEVERREAFVVGLTHVSTVVDQLTHHSILTVNARHVQSRVPERVGFVYLSERTLRW